ncbi:amino acid ABC transporter substrate-binding protein [Streptomyces sp. HC44]|uniref:Amino acid ABC transporter substrate-binding protein n=1 Tax=Streptomyces scabichelini TaxID=2711217 RepID=A0A6G4VCF4_9ACTN|nr:ABC transporter substrate-binding protein [Streptomyces scabichelini]NGO11585.1 amino acid ABC transporter substrate-binding protein [Streptomyces scabichelini]
MKLSRRELLRSTGRFGLAAGVALGTAPALAACGGSGSAGESDRSRLGWIQPKTGALAAAYKPAYAAARLAVQEINAAGGLRGEPVTLLEEDDEGKPGTQPTVARRLLRKEPQFVLGPTGSSQAVASVSALERGPVLQSAWGVADTLGDGRRFPFHYQLVFNTRQQATAVARYLFESRGVREIGLLVENSEYGDSIRRAFSSVLMDNYRTKAVSLQVFTPGTLDMAPFVKKLDRDGAKAVGLFSGQPQTSVLTLKAMTATGYAPLTVSHELSYIDAYDAVPQELMERFYTTTYAAFSYPKGSSPPTGRAREYAGKILAEPSAAGLEFTAATSPYYDFLMLLAEVVEREKTLAPDKLKNAFDKVTGYQGTRGKISFTSERHTGIDDDTLVVASLRSAKDKASMGGIFRELAPGSRA